MPETVVGGHRLAYMGSVAAAAVQGRPQDLGAGGDLDRPFHRHEAGTDSPAMPADADNPKEKARMAPAQKRYRPAAGVAHKPHRAAFLGGLPLEQLTRE